MFILKESILLLISAHIYHKHPNTFLLSILGELDFVYCAESLENVLFLMYKTILKVG